MRFIAIIAVLLTASMRAAAPMQDSAPAMTGQSVIHAGVEYDSNNSALRFCRVRQSSGDHEVDVAICELVRRCVEEKHTAGGSDTVACIKHRVARLAALVDAGLLQTPAAGKEGNASNEVVVKGVRSPPPVAGRWRFAETGTRQQIAGGNYLSLFKIVTLPPRSWHLCIKADVVAEMLAAMLREDRYSTAKSPCGWSIESKLDHFEGTQSCTVRNGLIRGTLTGSHGSSDFFVEKETKITNLFVTPIGEDHAGGDPSRNSSLEGGSGSGAALGMPALSPAQYLERTEVEGHRIGHCRAEESPMTPPHGR